jgi:predicted aspartyl protease
MPTYVASQRTIGSEQTEMGRIVVDFVVASNRDVLNAGPTDRIPESIPHLALRGVVDTGAARLVLPGRVLTQLTLEPAGSAEVRYADNRRATRPRFSNVWVRLLDREGVFSATIEPDREDALIGAIVLEELDLIVDCATQTLHPRNPDHIVTEIE